MKCILHVCGGDPKNESLSIGILTQQKTEYHLMIFGRVYPILSDYYFLNARFFYPKVDDRRKDG